MEQSPWEANSYSASHEITRLLRNPKVHYRVHRNPPLVPVLSQMNPVHTFLPYFTKIHSNIILPSKPSSSELHFSDRNFLCVSHLSHACYMTRLSLDRPNKSEMYKLWSSLLCSLFHYLAISSLLGPYNLLSFLFSNTLNECYCLSERDKVSHPYKTADKIIVLIHWSEEPP
jgi:hypothetical protein